MILEEDAVISAGEALTTIDLQLEKLREVLALNPDDIPTLMAYAEYHFRKGKRFEALQAYQKIAVLKQDIIDVYLALAKIYMLQNLIQESYRELLKVFELAPGNVEAHVLFDRLFDITPPPDEMKEDFDMYRVKDPGLEDLQIYKYEKILEREKIEQEISQLESIMNNSDDEPIYEYNYEMALKRRKSIDDLFSYIQSWEEYIKEMKSSKPEPDEVFGEEEVPQIIHIEETELSLTEVEEIAVKPEMQKPVEEKAEQSFADQSINELFPESNEEIEHGIIEISGEKANVEDQIIKPEKSVMSSERLAFYEDSKGRISSILESLLKTKGVTALLGVTVDGYVICDVTNESFDGENVKKIIRNGVGAIKSWRTEDSGRAFIYWVLEFEKGLIIIRSINKDHCLFALANAGVNFGALRYSIEKEKDKLSAILSNMPIV